jgi:hypothetical protein
VQLRSAAGSSTPSAAARRGAGRQRQRDLASDLPLIQGGIALASVALLGFGTLIALALAFGIAQDWPPLAWVALALLALPLLALLALFLRDLLRWRRQMELVRRG